MIRIVLAEDLTVVREGIRALLHSHADLTVVGEAANGQKALEMVEKHQPDVLITNLFLPGTDTLRMVRRINAEFPHTRVIILSACSQERYVLQALKDGALGYVDKSFASADLIRGVHAVLQGRRYLKPPLPRRVINEYLSQAKPTTLDVFETLTPRENEVLHHLLSGLTNAEIAKRLSISATTVTTHRAHLMKKLGVHNRTELLLFAVERGILPGPAHMMR